MATHIATTKSKPCTKVKGQSAPRPHTGMAAAMVMEAMALHEVQSTRLDRHARDVVQTVSRIWFPREKWLCWSHVAAHAATVVLGSEQHAINGPW